MAKFLPGRFSDTSQGETQRVTYPILMEKGQFFIAFRNFRPTALDDDAPIFWEALSFPEIATRAPQHKGGKPLLATLQKILRVPTFCVKKLFSAGGVIASRCNFPANYGHRQPVIAASRFGGNLLLRPAKQPSIFQ